MTFKRRDFVKWLSASAVLSGGIGHAGAATTRPVGRVLVIGGGFAGATAAKYLRMWSPDIEVTLVERNPGFVSCPLSNRVLAGVMRIEDLTRNYDGLQSVHGVKIVRDQAMSIDAASHSVRLAGGGLLYYDRLIVAPGVDLLPEEVAGLDSAPAQARILHA
ncbi:MAG: FAD-dependent oxidoreductase, partial [Burkholderiales bacterium]